MNMFFCSQRHMLQVFRSGHILHADIICRMFLCYLSDMPYFLLQCSVFRLDFLKRKWICSYLRPFFHFDLQIMYLQIKEWDSKCRFVNWHVLGGGKYGTGRYFVKILQHKCENVCFKCWIWIFWIFFIFCDYWFIFFSYPVIMAAICNRAGHYIFPCDFFLLFPRLISAATDWMSAILPHMVWP